MCSILPGMIHAGSGVTQINALLSSLDVLHLTATVMKDRSDEVGPVIETVAQRSCQQARDEERQAQLAQDGVADEGQTVALAVSYDAAWHKPRGFNSLTGI